MRPAGSFLLRRSYIKRPFVPENEPVGINQKPPVDSDPQIGDYPNLPYVSYQSREPLGWDDLQERRNDGETVLQIMAQGHMADTISLWIGFG